MPSLYSGNLIRATPLKPTQLSASGIWTLDQAEAAVKNNSWPVANSIPYSLRFRGTSASTYLTRNISTDGSLTTGTFSFWIKGGDMLSGNYS